MRAAIMQPYFFPYIGYFQLIGAVDLFILYDNIKYTKKGWINRNRVMADGKVVGLSLPLKNAPDVLDVRERRLASDFNCQKLINRLRGAYQQAPYYKQAFPVIERILRQDESNLFKFLYHSIVGVCEHLGVAAKLAISSEINIDHSLKGQDKVLALCEAVNADVYLNAIGGVDLYSREEFQARGIELRFIRSKPFAYLQFDHDFIPWLSIIDVLMFNSLDTIRECLRSNYELV